MPVAPPRPCNQPGCAALTDRSYCPAHRRAVYAPKEERRESAAKRGYDSKWVKASKGYLRHHPLCVACLLVPRTEPSTLVDHIVPHRGDMKKFWDKTNWQALCKPCHDTKTAHEVNARRRC